MHGQARWVAALLVAAGAAAAAPAYAESKVDFVRACTGPGIRCGVRIAMRDGVPVAPPFQLGNLAPADLQAAYHIDPQAGAGVTVAIVDAYSYAALEADLGVYRTKFGLPDCTVANGCLRIVNDQGKPSPLPSGVDAGWMAETALDMDMVSAACPRCNIVVVETEAGKLDAGERAAAALAVDAISVSWGSIESGGELARETTFHNVGIGTFAASGDMGNNSGGDGPEYPATSAFAIGVGGTHLQKDPGTGTFHEAAWQLAGSSCSKSIATPSFQTAAASSACPMRASSDVSADADPDTGVAIYESAGGGWLVVGGTSAAAPLVAALMAAAGHGDITPDFLYRHPEAFHDITAGSNGPCGNTLCDAGSGWDGPTGLGSPDQSALVAIGGGVGPTVAITSPVDGSTQDPGFSIEVTPGAGTVHVDLAVDGVRVAVAGAPFTLVMPADVAAGSHDLTVTAYDDDHNSQSAALKVDLTGGGCSTTGGPGGIALIVVGVGLVTARRRRRAFPLNM